MVTRLAFTGLVVALAGQRLLELRKSRTNERELLHKGAREHASRHFTLMRLLHASWLVAMPLEVFLLRAPFRPPLALLATAGAASGQALRYAAMHALGPRWTVRIFTLPGEPAVTSGIYKRLRHPNYVGVALEIACVPLIHGAWRSALAFSALNALLLRVRIRSEERALAADSRYTELFASRPRFVPKLARSEKAPAALSELSG
jgi:methyltransferase